MATVIILVHKASRGRYGEPRVSAQLARDGVVVNHKTVERLMAREGLQGLSGKGVPAELLRQELLGSAEEQRCFRSGLVDRFHRHPGAVGH